MNPADLRELASYALTQILQDLVFIAVVFRQMLSMMTDILIRDVVYVGLYRSDQGKPTSPQFPLPFMICIYIFLRNDFIVRDYKT